MLYCSDMTKHEEVLTKHGLPIPDGVITDLKWKARFGDWYARVEAGWLWYDNRDKTWQPCMDPS